MTNRRWTYLLFALTVPVIWRQEAFCQQPVAAPGAVGVVGPVPGQILGPASIKAQGEGLGLPQGQVPKAIVTPRPAAKPKPPSLAASARDAATKASDGDYLGAIQVWSRVVQLGPVGTDKLQGYLQRAKLKRQIGDNKGALQDLDLALKIDQNSVACLMERAALRRRMNDNHGALEDLNKVIEVQPQKAEAYVDRGKLRMLMGDYVGSGTDYHTAVVLNPALKSKVSALVQPQTGAKLDIDTDSNTIAAAAATAPASSIKADRGRDKDTNQNQISSSLGKRPLGSPGFSTLRQIVSGQKRVYSQAQLARLNNASVKQINDGQFEEAVKTLNELIDAAPDYAHARENLTIAHNNWGLELAKRTPAEAAKQFRQALYLDPSQGTSRRNLDAMIKEIGKNPKDADDRLALAKESLANADKRGAFVEASEAAKLRNTPAVREALSDALKALAEEDQEAAQEAAPLPEAAVLGTIKPMISESAADASPANPAPSASEGQPLAVVQQAKAMAGAGQISDAEELLSKLISHIKGRAAVDESTDFAMLDLALDTLADMYLKTGSYVQAQTNLSELVTLRESSKDHGDPILGTTYREYAKVLKDLNREAEAKVYEAKADAILDNKQAHR